MVWSPPPDLAGWRTAKQGPETALSERGAWAGAGPPPEARGTSLTKIALLAAPVNMPDRLPLGPAHVPPELEDDLGHLGRGQQPGQAGEGADIQPAARRVEGDVIYQPRPFQGSQHPEGARSAGVVLSF